MTYDDKLRQQIKDELLNLDELDQHNMQFSEQIIAETDWENEWKTISIHSERRRSSQ